MQIERKIAEMGLDLIEAPTPMANYIPTVRVGDLLFVAGHLPRLRNGSILHTGKVGREVTVEEGYAAAQQAMINCLASIRSAISDLDKVKRVVKLLVMVNADPEFDEHFVVANGASDLLVKLYGEQGRHARSAVGMGGLPRRSCVEVEMIVQVAD
jgi:enamine deaminase RidA (YjgF/YER057c/UK114 family)